MTALNWIVVYIAGLVTFLVVDLVWLGVVAKGVYRDRMGDMLADKPNWPVALAFYALFVIGVLYFAVAPGVDDHSLSLALRNGALFGLFTYATYDLTCLAVLRGFSGVLAVIDIAWGVVLSTTVSAAAYLVARTVG